MAGRPGRSGGSNRLSIEEHVLRGTFNPTRHGRRVAAVAAAGQATHGPVPAALVEGLSGRGLAFVHACWAHYAGWTPPTLVLLREAGRLLDEIEALRGQPGERAAQRVLLSVLGQLRLEA